MKYENPEAFHLECGLKILKDRASPYQAFYDVKVDINRGEATAILAEIDRLRSIIKEQRNSIL